MEMVAEDRSSIEAIARRGQGDAREAPSAQPSGRTWAGRIMSGLVIAFLAFDAAVKLLRLAPVVDGTVALGYPAGIVLPLGLVLIACVAAYAVPRTSVPGAILLTAYLGGAVATHARVGDPLFKHVLFPVYVAALVWGGLCLPDRRVSGVLLGRG